MAKRLFDFSEDKEPVKTVDDLFEEQFANRKTESSSALPPDIPMSLKDINKVVNASAFADSGLEPEATLEYSENTEENLEEEITDLEEYNEEVFEELEEETDLAAEKKKKRKADREKGRKNEKAYQEKTRKMEEANRQHEEEMRKEAERLRQQEEANRVSSVHGEDISEAEKRNQALRDDDFEIEKNKQAQVQKEKTEAMINEQRAREEAAKNFEGYGSKNIDFSGRHEHGKVDENAYDNEAGRGIDYKSEEYRPAEETKTEINRNNQNVEKTDYKEPVKTTNYQSDKPLDNPSYSDHSEQESSSRRQEKQYIDDDYINNQKAQADERREQIKNGVAAGAVMVNEANKEVNPSSGSARVDYKTENVEHKQSYNEPKFDSVNPSHNEKQGYQEGQTSSSVGNQVDHSRRDITDRTEAKNNRESASSFQNNDNYKRNSDYSDSINSGKHTEAHKRSGNSYSSKAQPTEVEKNSGLPTGNDSGSGVEENRRTIKASAYRYQDTSYKVGSGKDLGGAGNSTQSKDNKLAYGVSVLGSGKDLEDSKERSFVNPQQDHYRKNTLDNTEPVRIYIKEEPFDRQNKSFEEKRNIYTKNKVNKPEGPDPTFSNEKNKKGPITVGALHETQSIPAINRAIELKYSGTKLQSEIHRFTEIKEWSYDTTYDGELVYFITAFDENRKERTFTLPQKDLQKGSLDLINNPYKNKIEGTTIKNKTQDNTSQKKPEISGKPVNSFGGGVGVASNSFLNKMNKVKENNTTNHRYHGVSNPNGPNRLDNQPKAKGATFNSQINFNERKDTQKEIKKKTNNQSLSTGTVKHRYAKQVGLKYASATGRIGKTILNQALNTLKEDENMNTANKIKIAASGVMAVGSYAQLSAARTKAGVNFFKAKHNQVSRAWEYFKGPQEVMAVKLNLERGANSAVILNTDKIKVRKEFEIVPSSIKQFDKALKADAELSKLTDKQIKKQLKALKGTAKTKVLTLEEKIKLVRLQKQFDLRKGRKKLLVIKQKAAKFTSAIAMLGRTVLNSNDLSASTVSTGLQSFRYIKGGLKLVKSQAILGTKAVGFTFRTTARAGKFVGKTVNKIPVVNKMTTAASNTAPVTYIKGRVVQVKELRNVVGKGINGGAYRWLQQHQPKSFKKIKAGIDTFKSSKPVTAFKTVKAQIGSSKPVKGLKKAIGKVGSFAGKVGKVGATVGKVVAAPAKAISFVASKLLLAAGIALGSYALIVVMVSVFQMAGSVFATDTDNLQKYVNVLIEERATDMLEVMAYQNQGGKEHGKYKNVTINYLDPNGNQVDSTDNMKEILSMIAVKINNEWPQWTDNIGSVFTGSMNSSDVKAMITQLWNDSHTKEITEIGPYACSGCEERDYKCTDELPSDASSERIKFFNLYAGRGGCIEYDQAITYYCSNDTAKWGMTSVGNAHSQAWANNTMKELFNKYNSQGGCELKHEVSKDSPAWGCNNYLEGKYIKSTLPYTSGWPKSSITLTWNTENNRYEFVYNTTTYYINKSYVSDTLTYTYANNRYELYGKQYTCREYKCDGHSTTVKHYRCDGHTEIYCPKDHYDLTVNLTIYHLPELYGVDSNAKGVVDAVPEADAILGHYFDESTRKVENFYWDTDNREICENYYNQDWKDLYEGLVGLESGVITGDPLTPEQIQAYMDNLPEDLSADRKAVLEVALDAVGKIPYYWGGYASMPGLEGNNFGTVVSPDNKGRNLKGLDCSHFVDWVCWTALDDNLGNGWTGTIWDKSTAISPTEIQPGDIGFQNEGGNSVNHVGFYLGNGIWIHCSGSAGNVVANQTSVFSYYRRLNIIN